MKVKSLMLKLLRWTKRGIKTPNDEKSAAGQGSRWLWRSWPGRTRAGREGMGGKAAARVAPRLARIGGSAWPLRCFFWLQRFLLVCARRTSVRGVCGARIVCGGDNVCESKEGCDMNETGRGRKEGDKAAAAADPVLDQRISDLILGRGVVNAYRTSYSGADVYTHESLVAAMGETAAERKGYGAGGGSSPMLYLKPRWVAEDERLVEVLEAMARYVRAGKAVPGAWREELEELLALRGSRFSKQCQWETFPEPAKPNVPQSEADRT